MSIGSWIDFDSISGWTVVWLVVTAVGTWLAARYGRRAVARLLGRVDGLSDDYSVTAARIAGYLVVLLGIGIALTILGANVQPLLIIVLIVGLVAFLALRGVADNFGASLVLQTRKPAHLGDVIEVRTTALDHLDDLRDTLLGSARHTAGVRSDPPPDLVWVGSSPDRLVGRLRVWHAPPDGTSVVSAVVLSASQALRDAGVAASLTAPPPPPALSPAPEL